jgi:hypothetical protein
MSKRPSPSISAGSDVRVGSTERYATERQRFRCVLTVDVALSSVTMGDDDVDLAVTIDVGWTHRRRGLFSEREAILVEAARTAVQTDVVGALLWSGAIRHDDIGQPIAIHIDDADIARTPLGLAVDGSTVEPPLAVV